MKKRKIADSQTESQEKYDDGQAKRVWRLRDKQEAELAKYLVFCGVS